MKKPLNKFENKVFIFSTMLKNSYRDEEQSDFVGKLKLSDEELTDDFTAMLYAVYVLYQTLTEDDSVDFIGFTHLCNRLAVQHLMVPKEDQEDE